MPSPPAAVEIGERFADPDLIACARHLQGRVRLQQGQIEEGLALLDEAMVAVDRGELSPIMTGLIYCSVIEACQQVYALDRAREWTAALARWCDEQPEMVAFTGTLPGASRRDHAAARRLAGRASRRRGAPANVAWAINRQADARGPLPASRGAPPARGVRGGRGGVPRRQPSGARAAAGPGPAAAGAGPHRRGGRGDPPRCGRDDRPAAAHAAAAGLRRNHAGRRRCSRQRAMPAASWRRSPQGFDRPAVLGAMAAHARGAVELAEGDAQAALGSLRHAVRAVAAGRRALPGRARPRARRAGLSRPRRRRRCRAGARSGPGGVRSSWGPRRTSRASTALVQRRGAGPSRRPDPARAAGAAPGRHRQDQQGHRRRAVPEREDSRPACEQHLHQAGRPVAGRAPPPTPTSTSSSELARHGGIHPCRRSARIGWFCPKRQRCRLRNVWRIRHMEAT